MIFIGYPVFENLLYRTMLTILLSALIIINEGDIGVYGIAVLGLFSGGISVI